MPSNDLQCLSACGSVSTGATADAVQHSFKPMERTVRNLLAATLGAAALLAGIAGHASAQSNDGKDRWVNINNVSGFQTIVSLYAVPSHLSVATVSGSDLLGNVTIRPGQSYRMNFDDGRGTCFFDVRATSNVQGRRDWIVRNFNVCARSDLNMGS
jgi:hypothetical protein